MKARHRKSHWLAASLLPLVMIASLVGCARTEVIESPKTGSASEAAEVKEPAIIWTSRVFTQDFDYLGQIKVRSWTYNGAVERLTSAAKNLRADAVIDIHYDEIGFFTTLEAFAIKYK
jgi:hypothetical protein